MNRFTNKVAIITGAATGIGYEIAKQLAAEGASIVLNDLNENDSKTAAKTIEKETNGTCISYSGDAGDVDFIYKMVAFTVAEFGKIDIAVANAGITLFGDFLNFKPESFQKVMNLNLQGSFFLTQAVARAVQKQGEGGRILLMSSVIGYQGYPNLTAYSMTKAAIKMMARNLVAELSPLGIRINAVAPGATLTERTLTEEDDYWNTWSKITPLNQIATTNDIAKVSLFLLSDDAQHITGQTLLVDGGWEAMGVKPHR